MEDLQQLARAKPPELLARRPQLSEIHSPLRRKLPAWRQELRDHGDRRFAKYILDGIEHGFRVGFDHSYPLVPASRNMPSASSHAEVIDAYIAGEVAEGRMLGPFQPGSVEGLQVNRMGVIPKGHTPGKWRLITDLSFPEEASVNKGIDPAFCSLRYTSVERVATAAMNLGKGFLLAKLDIKSAYRLLPVHPIDRPLLGVAWQGKEFVDGMLPFGLRSAPKIFTAVADALEWVLRQNGVVYVDHYLDDFILFGPSGSSQCADALQRTLQICKRLGVPLAMEKLEGPVECITFLGIEVDTRSGTMRLPTDKLGRVQQALQEWAKKKACKRRELESLIGTLQHACRVVRPGRSFLRRMIDLLRIPRQPHHFVRLNKDFRADLQWWLAFVGRWNGVAIIPSTAPPHVEVTSDASGHWGCGAWSQTSWFQFEWPSGTDHHITFKELCALLIAAVVWGPRWQGRKVQWWCDNQAAVHAVTSRSCRDPSLMHLLRCLFFLEARYQLQLVASHVPGVENALADDLSRNRLPSFLLKAPAMEQSPTLVPSALPPLLLGEGNWTCRRWTRSFTSMLTGD